MAKMNVKWCMKCCPICGGDMYMDVLMGEMKCLQCGRTLSHTRSPEEQAALRAEAEHGRKVRLPA